MSDGGPSLAGIAPIGGFKRQGNRLGIMVDPDVTGYVSFGLGDEVRVEIPDAEDIVAPVERVHIEHGLMLWLDTDRDPEGVHWV